MSDKVLKGCAEVKTMKDAQKPIITPLLPVKGLRHDENGDLTTDAMNTITDGMASLGIDLETEDAQNAILLEAREALCNLNAQYQYLLATLLTSIHNNEAASESLIELLRDKNMTMRDILSVSRQIMEKPPAPKDGIKLTEGWTDVKTTKTNIKNTLEGFTNMQNKLVSDANSLNGGQYAKLAENFTASSINVDEQRAFDISNERMSSVSANLALYSFLNIIAAGLLLYIVSTN